MSESTQMMLGLLLGIVVMIILVSKTKVRTYIYRTAGSSVYRRNYRRNAAYGYCSR